MVTRKIRSNGDERGMLVYGSSLTASGAPRVSVRAKGCKFRPVRQRSTPEYFEVLSRLEGGSFFHGIIEAKHYPKKPLCI